MRTRAPLESYFRSVLSTYITGSLILDKDALQRALLLEVTRWLRGEAAFYQRNNRRDAAVIVRQLAHNVFDGGRDATD